MLRTARLLALALALHVACSSDTNPPGSGGSGGGLAGGASSSGGSVGGGGALAAPIDFDCGDVAYVVTASCNDGSPEGAVVQVSNETDPLSVAGTPVDVSSSVDCDLGEDTTGGKAVQADLHAACKVDASATAEVNASTVEFKAHAERICGTGGHGSAGTVQISWSGRIALPDHAATYKIDVHTTASSLLPSFCRVFVEGKSSEQIAAGDSVVLSAFVENRSEIQIGFDCADDDGIEGNDGFVLDGCYGYSPDNPSASSPPELDAELSILFRVGRCPESC